LEQRDGAIQFTPQPAPARKEADMELRYHSCGHPIRVRPPGEFGAPYPTYFDAKTAWNEGPISCCPQCGAILTPESLRERPADPAATLAAYLLAWPYVKRQLESLIAERMRRDPHFYGYHAQEEINELEYALNRVAELAARLQDPFMTHAEDRPV